MKPDVALGCGCAMAVIGLYFFISAIIAIVTGIKYPPYKWLAIKSQSLWKEKVDYFYLVVGIIITIIGILMATSIIWVN